MDISREVLLVTVKYEYVVVHQTTKNIRGKEAVGNREAKKTWIDGIRVSIG